MVVGTEGVGDEPGVGELVLVRILDEPDGERLHGLAHVARHQGDDEARVEAAAQHRSQRHVAHQPQAHRLLEPLEQALHRLLERALRSWSRLGVRPVLLDADPVGVDHERVPRHQLGDAGERRGRCGEEAEGEVGVDRLVVERVADEAGGEQALELGGEDDQVADARVVERLHSEAVARDHGPAALPVPHRQAELAPQLRREVGAVLLVEVRQDLRVAAAREGVTGRAEALADVEVVVELAVLHAPDLARLVRERLVATLDVDDAQPADAERDAVDLVRPAVVRPAMRHRVRHAVEHVRRDDLARLPADLNDSTDSAHLVADGIRAASALRPPPGQTGNRPT